MVVDTQRGQVCIQPAAEGGMVRGPRVGGEQLPGMGGIRVGDETPSEVGFGGQPGAHETLGEPIGPQATHLEDVYLELIGEDTEAVPQ